MKSRINTYLAIIIILLSSASTPLSAQTVNDGYGDYLLVPAGEFLMGDNFNEGYADELPVHTVYLSDYYIGKYEITVSQYADFLNDKGYDPKWTVYNNETEKLNYTDGVFHAKTGYENHPIRKVTWFGAEAYCKWLTEKTGKTYRLPTEAEWEKAARGDSVKNAALGHQRRYPWGDYINGYYANYGSGDELDKHDTTPVGYYDGSDRDGFQTKNGASPYGAHDMAGNALEWCSDWYGENYYSESILQNPKGPDSGSNTLRRGGIGMGKDWARSIRRGNFSPFGVAGFRCVREYETTGIDEPGNAPLPVEFRLEQNYPNPFNPETVIRYSLPKTGRVTVAVFTITGQSVATLENTVRSAGTHIVRWNGTDSSGRNAASGVYLCRLSAGGFTQTVKMILLR